MKLTFYSRTTPDQAGYGDSVVVNDGEDSFPCSCCPNPFKPSTRQGWELVYGWVAPGEYKGKVVDHPKHGRCVLLNGGGEIPARFQNYNHGGKAVVSEVFFHEGGDKWRGSAGCLTAPPLVMEEVMNHFIIGDEVDVEIISATEGTVA